MRLAHGSRLGPYEVGALIGAGGMGEVYRARDTKLHRDVAIKVLPDLFAADPTRRARLEREAQVLASLNHPHIATIYGLEEANGTYAVVMELVEGEDLTQRIGRGALPLDEALHIAGQLAEALAAAHRQHVIHRDLKPANIKLRGEGTVKVLDFGLAKALDAGTSLGVAAALSDSPTITSPAALSGTGILLGTAAYMSPEQARGKVVDKRTDIWAFGVVLYEMLTGTPLHGRESLSETLACVLKDVPNLTRVPPSVRRLLRSCLQKDPADRLHDISDWRLGLDDLSADVPVSVPLRRQWLWPAMAALPTLGFLAVVVQGVMRAPEKIPKAPLEYMEFSKPADLVFIDGTQGEISPDGMSFAFAAKGPDAVPRMYLRRFDSPEVRPLPGSEGIPERSPPPFWSYDSLFVLYAADGQLRKSAVKGTPAQPIAEANLDIVQGGTSSQDGVILYARRQGILEQVSLSGGTPTPVTVLAPGETGHRWPQFLPDGRRFLYLRVGLSSDLTGIYVGSLDVAPDKQQMRPLLTADSQARWVTSNATGKSYLLMQREGTLVAQPFDVATATLSGTRIEIAHGVGAFVGANAGMWSAARAGRLMYRSGGTDPPQWTWLDAKGGLVGMFGEPSRHREHAVSPNGDRVAYVVATTGGADIWIQDVEGGGTVQLTSAAGHEILPVWSFDGTKIMYAANRGRRFQLYEKSADGRGEESLLYTSDQDKRPTDASRDFLLFSSSDPKADGDIWVLDLRGNPSGTRQAYKLVGTDAREDLARFDPEQRWIVYVSSIRGDTPSLIARPFSPDVEKSVPDEGVKWSVATPGTHPRFSPDGNRLYYLAGGHLMSVDVLPGSGANFDYRRHAQPVISNFTGQNWSLRSRPSGVQFLVGRPKPNAGPPPPFRILSNWIAHTLEP